MPNQESINNLLELRGVSKSFPGVKALDGIDLMLKAGEVHLLLGENGAGKSTLIKCIVGVELPETGEIILQGERLTSHRTIQDSYDKGIGVIYQELSDIHCLSVMDNMFLGREVIKGEKWGLVNRKEQRERCLRAMQEVGLEHVDPDALMESLGMGQKQMFEVAKAIERNAKLLIMDEPTASLSRSEINHLLEIILKLKEKGVAILFITHKLDEAKKVGDVVTVLKDGKKIGKTQPIANVTEDEIIHMMVGRELSEKYPARACQIGQEAYRVEGISGIGFQNVSFHVGRGELLGIFGLVGAGRTEAIRGAYGADALSHGQIYIDGKRVQIRSPRDSISNGVVLATENRKEEGLILIHDVVENVTLSVLERFQKAGLLLDTSNMDKKTQKLSAQVNLRPPHIHREAGNFSRGKWEDLSRIIEVLKKQKNERRE